MMWESADSTGSWPAWTHPGSQLRHCGGGHGRGPASVLGGLVSNPVIAVPASIGYGASLQGISALLTMLNSCANGIAVVNIDNGYGAGYMATQINRLACGKER